MSKQDGQQAAGYIRDNLDRIQMLTIEEAFLSGLAQGEVNKEKLVRAAYELGYYGKSKEELEELLK